MPLMQKYFHLDVSNVRWLSSNFDAFILFVFWCFISRWFCAMSLKQTNTMRVKVHTHTHYTWYIAGSVYRTHKHTFYVDPKISVSRVQNSHKKTKKKQMQELNHWNRGVKRPLPPSRNPSTMLEFKYTRTAEIKFSSVENGRRAHTFIEPFICISFYNFFQQNWGVLCYFISISSNKCYLFICFHCVCVCVCGTCFRLFASICSFIHAFFGTHAFCLPPPFPRLLLLLLFFNIVLLLAPIVLLFFSRSSSPHTLPISLLFPRVYVI